MPYILKFMTKSVIKQIVLKVFHKLGFDILKVPKGFEHNFLGLNRFPIRTIIDIGANEGDLLKKL